MVDIVDFEEIRRIQKEQDFKHVCMIDKVGHKVIRYNKAQQPAAQKIDEMEKRADILNGIYTIRFQNGTTASESHFDYYVECGDPVQVEVMAEEPRFERLHGKDEHVRSFQSAIEDNRTITRLEFNVQILQAELKQAEAYIAELEQTNRELGAMSDQVPEENTNVKMIETFMPVIDKYLELQEQKNALKAVELEAANPGLIVSEEGEVEADIQNKDQMPQGNDQFWQEYWALKQQDPEMAAKALEAFYQQGGIQGQA